MDFNYNDQHPPSSKAFGGGNWPIGFPDHLQCNFTRRKYQMYGEAWACDKRRDYRVYILSNFLSFLLLFLLALLPCVFRWICGRFGTKAVPVKSLEDVEENGSTRKPKERSTTPPPPSSRVCRLRKWATEKTYEHGRSGQALNLLYFFFSIASFVIYMRDALRFPYTLCSWDFDLLNIIDFFFQVFFLGYFLLRIIPHVGKFTVFCNSKNWVDLMILPTYFLENSGDPWLDYKNARPISLPNCLYFILVSFYPAGYGEIYMTTTGSKIAFVCFILIALDLMAKHTEELKRILSKPHTGRGDYTGERRNVLIAGHPTPESLREFFFNAFGDPDAPEPTDLLIMSEEEPTEEMADLVEEHRDKLHLFVANPMDTIDLYRMNMQTSKTSAIVIFANLEAEDAEAEDAANIVRAFALKNYDRNFRVVIQLLRTDSLADLRNVPGWSDRYDSALCLLQLAFGCMGQSCLVRGFSTLITNMLNPRPVEKPEAAKNKDEEWLQEYGKGESAKLYIQPLSPSFTGLPFAQAAEILYSRFGVLLVALEPSSGDPQKPSLMVNPKDEIIQARTFGLFLAHYEKHAKEAAEWNPDEKAADSETKLPSKDVPNGDLNAKLVGDHAKEKFEVGGHKSRQHTPPVPSFADSLVDLHAAEALGLRDHVVVCVVGGKATALSALIRPLRAANLPEREQKAVILIGKTENLKKEWSELQAFDRVWILAENPRSRAALQAAAVDRSSMVVIVGPQRNAPPIPPVLSDSEVIVATLNVYRFRREGGQEDEGVAVYKRLADGVIGIPTMTLLSDDRSASMLNGEMEYWEDEVRFTETFACGRVFPISSVNRMLAAFHNNRHLLPFFHKLVNCDGELGSEAGDSRICLMNLSDLHYEDIGEGSLFGDLVKRALREHGRLPIGLYRRSDGLTLETPENRYVLGYPPPDYRLLGDDQVFVLRQYNDVD
ncbi:BK channel [Aphelenchoides fujianensis]|nr:BK channel [Aphelenchoides fujianensis]